MTRSSRTVTPLSISVVIPTFRREAALRDTIADVLKQEYPQFEVIVVDSNGGP